MFAINIKSLTFWATFILLTSLATGCTTTVLPIDSYLVKMKSGQNAEGSGVVVSGDGDNLIVITAAHVFNKRSKKTSNDGSCLSNENFTIREPLIVLVGKKELPVSQADVLCVQGGVDGLALLKVKSEIIRISGQVPIAKLLPRAGSDLQVRGYQVAYDNLAYLNGPTYAAQEPGYFTIGRALPSGFSGGAVADNRVLVGIVVQADDVESIVVSGPKLRSLLKKNNIPVRNPPSAMVWTGF